MNTQRAFVSAAEAAYIGGISPPQVNRLVDEELVPRSLLLQQDGARRFARLSAAFATFFFANEGTLVAAVRKRILVDLTARVNAMPSRDLVLALQVMPRDIDWRFADTKLGLSVDISRFVLDAMARAKDVDNADKLVSTDPEVMGGMPCFTGTRVPIENVLASIDKGIPIERVVDAYPFLTKDHIDAALVYVQVHPRRGRPPRLREVNPATLRKVTRVVRPVSA